MRAYPTASMGISYVVKKRYYFTRIFFYPEGPHLGIYFTKPINLKGFPHQGHVMTYFLISGM
jgi:hypothetical protein